MHAPATALELAAVDVAVRSAAVHDILIGQPLVAGVSKHVVLLFDDLVAKVTRDYLTDQVLEASVLRQLIDAPAPRLAFDDAPHRVEGWSVLWLERLVDAGPVEVVPAMKALADLHDHLRSVTLDGVMTWDESLATGLPASEALSEALRIELQQAHTQWVAPLLTQQFPSQLLHGDAYLDNAIATADGVRWLDFENIRWGPIEYDLAVMDDVTGYPAYDEELAAAFRRALIVNGAIWRHRMAQLDARHGDKAAWALHRVRALRD